MKNNQHTLRQQEIEHNREMDRMSKEFRQKLDIEKKKVEEYKKAFQQNLDIEKKNIEEDKKRARKLAQGELDEQKRREDFRDMILLTPNPDDEDVERIFRRYQN